MRNLQFIPLGINLALTVSYLWNYQPGKFLYWLGATLLTIGIIKMEG
jgi:hypothetical protein